jgi:hypothetical protein
MARLVTVTGGLALVAVLLAGCGGGGDDRATVEAGLRHYLSSIDTQACLGSRFCGQGAFPVGAGVPRVRENSCKKIHIGSWSCVVSFGRTALPFTASRLGNRFCSSACRAAAWRADRPGYATVERSAGVPSSGGR